MAQKAKKDVQALTLRIPIEDYNLLRAEAFVVDRSINEVVLAAIRTVLDRERLTQVLEYAREARRGKGGPTDLPRNPQGRGPNKRRDSP